jgi:cellulose synthase/poly-beta-1,6-N-acetylglucosamine synthase-like glycosyltransferase
MAAISVIIPVFDQALELDRCLQALARQSLDRRRFEVLVVDNGSAKPAKRLSRRHRTRFLIQPLAGSYAARNLGAERARHPLLAFTDADCLPHPDWLGQAVAAARKQPGTAAWGGRIDMPRGAEPTAVERLEAHWGRNQRRWVEREGWADTANLIVRRAAFNRAGGFPEVLSGGDQLFGARLRSQGMDLGYLDQAAVTHPPQRHLEEFFTRQRRLASAMHARPQAVRGYLREALFLLSGPLHPAWEYFRSGASRSHGRPLEFVVLRAAARAVLAAEWTRLSLGGRPPRR